MTTIITLGIDIAKGKFDVALLQEGKFSHKSFPNKPEGFDQLQQWLVKHQLPSLHACMEATGTYGEALAEFLGAQGYKVSVVNPTVIKNYGKSLLSRNKTDKVDAKIIAQYCLTHQPRTWSAPPVAVKQLQALVRRLETLISMQQEEKNRLTSGTHPQEVMNSLQTNIIFFDEQIKQIKALIKQHLDNDPDLRQQKDLLLSIPGIGPTTAAHLLAELVQINNYENARQAAAYAGLTPQHKESGKSAAKVKLSKIGNGRVRKALYLPAVVAKTYNPLIKSFCERLAQKGKHAMVIIGAAMRKLLHLAYGVLKSGKPFDPNYLDAKAAS